MTRAKKGVVIVGDKLGKERVVTVCAACLRASCWHGEWMCEDARTAGTVERDASELDRLRLEHSDWYSAEAVARVCGSQGGGVEVEG